MRAVARFLSNHTTRPHRNLVDRLRGIHRVGSSSLRHVLKHNATRSNSPASATLTHPDRPSLFRDSFRQVVFDTPVREPVKPRDAPTYSCSHAVLFRRLPCIGIRAENHGRHHRLDLRHDRRRAARRHRQRGLHGDGTDAHGDHRYAGRLHLPELPVCVYKVTVELPGFKTVSREVQIAVNAVAKADFKLEVGAQSETITVEGVAPLVEFSDKLNNNVDKRAHRLDSAQRTRLQLAAQRSRPACSATRAAASSRVSISGARRTSNNFMIDGISNNDRYYGDSVMNQTGVVGVPATLVPMDAIAEFTVQQTPSAEFGVKGGAAINVVMKSGTNQPHGTAYYFRHDDWTDSPNFFVKKNGGDTTPVENQQYGGTFGGPIRKGQDVHLRLLRGTAPGGRRHRTRRPCRPTKTLRRRARASPLAGLTTNAIGENLLKLLPDRSVRRGRRSTRRTWRT